MNPFRDARAGLLGGLVVALLLPAGVAASTHGDRPEPPPTTASVLARTGPDDWRVPDPERTVYLEFGDRRVVIELAPAFAPAHVANIVALVRAGWFDQAVITRSQDNYVVQWGRPDDLADGPRGDAHSALPAEFDRSSHELPWFGLEDGDVYAAEAGWVQGFPAARDPEAGRTWLAHCYGTLGAGRGMEADSSDGSQLYVVIGHAPRHLDRNITQVGRVLHGIEHLSTLPRGHGPLGFYEKPEQRVALQRMVMAADVAEDRRTHLEILRTDTAAFAQLVQARRHRHEEWFIDPVGRVELCNVPIPVRERGD